jgi:hypothetical protein
MTSLAHGVQSTTCIDHSLRISLIDRFEHLQADIVQ